MNHTFSVVIPIRDNREQLRDCLDALCRQIKPPEFQVVVVDDGSAQPVPAELGHDYAFSLELVRQVPLGIAAARNTGVSRASGEIILFVDSDVVLLPDFMERLAASVEEHPGDSAFQSSLGSGKANLVERMEGLRLTATLMALDNGDGHVKYANTSAFAIRRSLVDTERDLFDPAAVRGEDTLLLAGLLRRRTMPRFVGDARAIHRPRVSLRGYIHKHFWIGYYTTPAREALMCASSGVILGSGGRGSVLKHMLAEASRDPADIPALPLVVIAHSLERAGRAAHRLFGLKPGRTEVLSLPVDCVRETELVARLISNAERGHGMRVTYLNAWTLVQAKLNSSMGALLHSFDICYPDGMGVVLCALLLEGRRLHKVTANNFIDLLCEQVALLGTPIALVGADRATIGIAAQSLKSRFPNLNLAGFSHGFLSAAEEIDLREHLIRWQPGIVIVGMGQPNQETWTTCTREALPGTVFLCVGGLFDYISGRKPTPPKLIRKIGMEWFYILLRRPKRFWKRYVFGLPMLALFVAREYVMKISAAARIGGGPRL